MRRYGLLAAGLAALLALPGAAGSQAQEAGPGLAPPAAPPASPPPKPKPRPKPKPKPKPPAPKEAAPDPQAAPVQPDASGAAPAEAGSKGSRPGKAEPARPATPAAALPEAAPTPDASFLIAEPTAPSDASLPIACDPGKAVHFDGPQAFSLWVTRSGTVRVDNPLRPLTPVVTRVVQLVIGEKLATAYGPDLLALRRGGSPAALEATLGGPIQWDARLGNLPDPLAIVSDSGQLLAELRFKECGDAPAVKAAPVAKGKKGKKAQEALAPTPAADPAPQRPAAPPPRRLPQGAIPE